jgi:hypothetical protein
MKKLILFFVFAALLYPTLATTSPKTDGPLDESQWQEITKDLDYTEKEREKKNTNWPSLPNFNLNGQLIKYAFFTLVLSVLIYFLVRYILTLQGNAAAREDMQVEVKTLREAEENPLTANLTALIAKLVAEGDYRGAVRAYFLLVLQTMHRNKRIEWKKPKTNFDYVREVANEPFQPEFSKLTYYFELVWYGQQGVLKNDFNRLEPEFTQLLKALKNDAK